MDREGQLIISFDVENYLQMMAAEEWWVHHYCSTSSL